MIKANYYYDLYLIIVTLLTILEIIYINKFNKIEKIKYVFLLSVAISIYIGFRPIDRIFGDVIVYKTYYNFQEGDNFIFSFNFNSFIFTNLFKIFASYKLGLTTFLCFIAFLYFTIELIALNKLFPNKVLFAFLIYLGAFSTFSYSVNGMKAGVAASLFTCALAYRDNIYKCIIFLFLSWGFHHSMHVCIISFFCVYFYNKSKLYFYIWCIALLFAIFHISIFQRILGILTDE